MKKIIKLMVGVFLSAFLLFCAPSVKSSEIVTDWKIGDIETGISVNAATVNASKKNGLVKEGKYYYYYDSKGRIAKNKWKNIGSDRYFFNEKGRAVAGKSMIRGKYVYVFKTNGKLYRTKKPSIVTVNKLKYYTDSRGHAATGWFIANNHLHYADSKGRLYMSDRSREGITFLNTGYAKKNMASDAKIEAMKIMDRITNSKMSKEQKLRAAWNYVINNMYYYSRYPSGNKGWQHELAYLGMKSKIGNCYGYACTFAALAREAGYDPYLFCARVPGSRDGASDGYTRHCWVTINGRHYDPEGQAMRWCRGVYNSKYYPCSYKSAYTVRYVG